MKFFPFFLAACILTLTSSGQEKDDEDGVIYENHRVVTNSSREDDPDIADPDYANGTELHDGSLVIKTARVSHLAPGIYRLSLAFQAPGPTSRLFLKSNRKLDKGGVLIEKPFIKHNLYFHVKHNTFATQGAVTTIGNLYILSSSEPDVLCRLKTTITGNKPEELAVDYCFEGLTTDRERFRIVEQKFDTYALASTFFTYKHDRLTLCDTSLCWEGDGLRLVAAKMFRFKVYIYNWKAICLYDPHFIRCKEVKS